MLHIFKMNGHRAAYDCTNRTYTPLSALALKVIDSIAPPLTPECPSSLRYAFAKYDSNDLSSAYKEVYSLYEKGLLFAESSQIAPAPAQIYKEISADAASVSEAIRSAIAEGDRYIIAVLTDGDAAAAANAAKQFSDTADIRLIWAPESLSLSDAEIASLNDSGCYVRIPSSGASLTEAVSSWADKGLRLLDMTLPASEETNKDLIKLEKELERRVKNGDAPEFAPFTFALYAYEGYNSALPSCSDCWAKEICGGHCLGANGSTSSLCDVKRTLIECAVTLNAESNS